MQKLAKSLGSLSWALPLFGMQQMSNAFRRSSDGTIGGDAVAAMDAVTQTTLGQCSSSVREKFATADKIQRDLIDVMFRFVGSGDGSASMMRCDTSMSDMMNPMNVVRRFTEQERQHRPRETATGEESELGWGPVPPID